MKRSTPLFSRPLAGLLVCLFLLTQSNAFARPITSKRILILSQAESPSSNYLKRAYETYGHQVTMVLLNASTQLNEEKGMIATNKTSYQISDFDLAYFRTWGQEAARNLAHRWQPILEKHGVPCVDPLASKLYNHNKHTMMRLFQDNKVPMPHTVIIDNGISVDTCIQTIKKQFKDMVVLKGEGCGGKNIQFIKVTDEAQLRSVLLKKYAIGQQIGPIPLVLQQYVPSKNQAGHSYHYRILVIGGEVIPAVKRFTANKQTLLASNASLGATLEMLAVDKIFSAEQQEEIKRACQLMKTNVAGVDATIWQGKLYIFEVNNSPALTSWAPAYVEKIVTYTTHRLARKL